jgi:hypothetical protein
MQIVIDPTSLEETASALRRAADVLGELCSLVAHAGDGVFMPPGVAAQVESVTASAASTIHAVLYELLDEAADLNRRAGCCCAGASTSLPVPALVGMAFGGGAISAASQVQLGSSVGAFAARGPGPPASAVSPTAAWGPGLAMAAPAVAAPAATGTPLDIWAALGGGSVGGGGSPVGSGISMVYDPTYDRNQPALGVSMVYDPTAVRSVPAGVGGVPLRPGSILDPVLRQQAISQPWGLYPNGTLLGFAFGNIPS